MQLDVTLRSERCHGATFVFLNFASMQTHMAAQLTVDTYTTTSHRRILATRSDERLAEVASLLSGSDVLAR